MSSFLTHLLIPTLVVLSLGVFRFRTAWAWSWPAWAVDVDYLGWVFYVKYGTYNFHRALFHNVWILVAAIVLAGNAYRNWRRSGLGLRFLDFSRAKPGWVLVPFFYLSHLLLDLFAGGIVLFWPLSERTFFWDFEIDVDTTKPFPEPIIVSEPGSYVGIPQVSEIYLWMTAEQFGIFLLYLASLFLLAVYESERSGSWRALWANRTPSPAPAAPAATTPPATRPAPAKRARKPARSRRPRRPRNR